MRNSNFVTRAICFLTFILTFSLCGHAQDEVDRVKIPSGDHFIYAKHYKANTEGHAPTLLLLHGFPGDFGDVLGLGEKLSGEGINVFTLTLSGISISEGVYGGSSPIDDLHHALDFFFTPSAIQSFNVDTSDFILGGWSFGGGLSMYIGAHDDRVSRIISIAGFNGDAFLTQCDEQEDFKKFMEAVFVSYKMRGIINFKPMSAIDDLRAHQDKFTPVAFADKLASKPMLLFGGTDDPEVSLTRHILPYYNAIRKKRGDIIFHVYQTGHRFHGYREALSLAIYDWVINNDSNDN